MFKDFVWLRFLKKEKKHTRGCTGRLSVKGARGVAKVYVWVFFGNGKYRIKNKFQYYVCYLSWERDKFNPYRVSWPKPTPWFFRGNFTWHLGSRGDGVTRKTRYATKGKEGCCVRPLTVSRNYCNDEAEIWNVTENETLQQRNITDGI